MLEAKIKTVLLASVFASIFGVSSAFAASPANISGNWSVTANQSLGALVIVQGVSAATCKPIFGTILGSNIQGQYCPSVGRLVFARLNAGLPFQLYEAHVARDAGIDRMGGSFLIWNAAGGGLANEGLDFNFSAVK